MLQKMPINGILSPECTKSPVLRGQPAAAEPPLWCFCLPPACGLLKSAFTFCQNYHRARHTAVLKVHLDEMPISLQLRLQRGAPRPPVISAENSGTPPTHTHILRILALFRRESSRDRCFYMVRKEVDEQEFATEFARL